MPKKNSSDTLLADCEPHFRDGVLVVAEFARRTQDLIRDAIERSRNALAGALGFPDDEISLSEYCWPDKLHKPKPSDEIDLGIRVKVADLLDMPIYRYWEKDNEVGIGTYIWIKGPANLKRLIKALDKLSDMPPGPEDSWVFESGRYSAYYMYRVLADSEVGQIASILDEFIGYQFQLLTKIGGIQGFCVVTGVKTEDI